MRLSSIVELKQSMCITNEALCHKVIWEIVYIVSHFLDMKLEMSVQIHAAASLSPEKVHLTHWIVGWVNPRAGLDDGEKKTFLILPEVRLWPPDRLLC